MNEKRRRLYQLVEVTDLEGNGTGEFIFLLKPEIASDWQRYLTPEELAKLQNLPGATQLHISLSTDPFRALDNA